MANTILNTTKTSMKRNKLLSFSTIFVTTIGMIISSVFISATILANKSVEYYEKRAQVMVYFKKGTDTNEILAFKDKINDPTLIEDIVFISQEDALSIYQEDFADDPDLLSTVTADSLPPSLEIRAVDVDSLLKVIDIINSEKETNANIDEVMYFSDVVDNLKTLAKIVNISSIVLISALLIITFSLIRITIGFNINAHKDEIKIMNLVGSTDRFIKLPFVLEGLLYGLIGGFISATLIIGPWYIIMYYLQSTDYSYWINQVLIDFDMTYLGSFNLLFVIIYYAVHMGVGSLIGVISSVAAVRKYLK